MSEVTYQEIFVATLEDPHHEYIFPDNKFNEVRFGHGGWSLMGLSKVQTELKDGDLIIKAFIGDKFVAKDFVFYSLSCKKNNKVVFSQSYADGEPFFWFKFEIIGGE